jgi:hypothetical protein
VRGASEETVAGRGGPRSAPSTGRHSEIHEGDAPIGLCSVASRAPAPAPDASRPRIAPAPAPAPDASRPRIAPAPAPAPAPGEPAEPWSLVATDGSPVQYDYVVDVLASAIA